PELLPSPPPQADKTRPTPANIAIFVVFMRVTPWPSYRSARGDPTNRPRVYPVTLGGAIGTIARRPRMVSQRSEPGFELETQAVRGIGDAVLGRVAVVEPHEGVVARADQEHALDHVRHVEVRPDRLLVARVVEDIFEQVAQPTREAQALHRLRADD